MIGVSDLSNIFHKGEIIMATLIPFHVYPPKRRKVINKEALLIRSNGSEYNVREVNGRRQYQRIK